MIRIWRIVPIMNGNLKKAIWKSALAAMLLASSSFAGYGFSDYRDRDQSHFVMKDPKPFRPDKEVVTVVMREAIPRGGGYTYQYPRENPEPVLTDKYAMEGALSMEIELIATLHGNRTYRKRLFRCGNLYCRFRGPDSVFGRRCSRILA